MLVLGISALDRDSHASLVGDDGVLAAVAEARLTRNRHQGGFPYRAVRECLRIAGASLEDIDAVAYPFWHWRREARALLERAVGRGNGLAPSLARSHALVHRAAREGGLIRGLPVEGREFEEHAGAAVLERLGAKLLGGSAWADAAAHQGLLLGHLAAAVRAHWHHERDLDASLTQLGLRDRLVRVEHHEAHVAHGLYTSGLHRALVITLGTGGSGLSGSVSLATSVSVVHRLAQFAYPHSLAWLPEQLADALGLDREVETALPALAAYGEPGLLRDALAARFGIRGGVLRHFGAHNPFFVRHLAMHFRRKDIVAAYQRVLEEACTALVAHHVARFGVRDVVLTGEVFTNARLVQRIASAPGVGSVWVPNSARDAGLGAALHVLAHRRGPLFAPLRQVHAFLGPAYSHGEIQRALAANELAWIEPQDLPECVAHRLLQGRLVARFEGRMEYGPRGLGNRVILAHARGPAMAARLNARLGRVPFVPCTPVTLWEDRHRYYTGLGPLERTAALMNTTVNCTPHMVRECPAGVHVDGTAQPLLLTREANPGLYAVLMAYKHLSGGVGTLLMAPLEVPGEPLVCTPEDAVRAFRAGRFDCLAIGSFFLESPAHASRAPANARGAQDRRVHDSSSPA